MNKQLKNQSQLEYVLRHLPDKSPAADLQKNIISSLPEYKDPWIKRMRQFFGPWPTIYRAAGAIACLVLAFYGGMQVDRFVPGNITVSGESAAVQNNMNDKAYYYLGRSLLAAGRAEDALNAFRSAELLSPNVLQYGLWKGAAYRTVGATDKERQTYQQLIIRRPESLSPRINLANNLLQAGQPREAEQIYKLILDREPAEKTALYNRALSLRMQAKTLAETEAWKKYLDYYRAGPSAYRALQHLHELGDYSFRIYQLGRRAVIINQKRLLSPQDAGINREINYLVQQFKNRSLSELSIVVFIEDDVQQAKNIADSLRMAIGDQTAGREQTSIHISWFDEPEPLETLGKRRVYLSKGVLIFSTLKNNSKKEERI